MTTTTAKTKEKMMKRGEVTVVMGQETKKRWASQRLRRRLNRRLLMRKTRRKKRRTARTLGQKTIKWTLATVRHRKELETAPRTKTAMD